MDNFNALSDEEKDALKDAVSVYYVEDGSIQEDGSFGSVSISYQQILDLVATIWLAACYRFGEGSDTEDLETEDHGDS